AFEVRKFTAGTNCGGGGTLSAATNVSQTSYTVPGSNIVPQPNTTNTLDSLGDRLMQKVQYRKVGSDESLWLVHTTRGGSAATTLPQTETQLIAGNCSQIGNCGTSICHRWGDYSSMSVDPSDGCTFWYTTEYFTNQTNGTNTPPIWSTRIGSFKFPSCAGATSDSITCMQPDSATRCYNNYSQ